MHVRPSSTELDDDYATAQHFLSELTEITLSGDRTTAEVNETLEDTRTWLSSQPEDEVRTPPEAVVP